MKFDPLLVPSLILEPLRYYFATYGGRWDLKWSEDDKESQIQIDHYYNFHNQALENRPRIIVSRGSYMINKTGLTDNLAESKSIGELRGARDRMNMVLISGNAMITVEARQYGTVERITNLASHFVVWSRPVIMDTHGFKEFGLPMGISEPGIAKEGTADKFVGNISFPYGVEELWRDYKDSIILKDVTTTLEQATTS